MEWVEVRGKTVDVAVEVGMKELGASEREEVDVEIIQEPEKGFLGLGGRDAVVRLKLRPKKRRRRRRKREGGDGDGGESRQSQKGQRQPQDRSQRGGGDRQGKQSNSKGRQQGQSGRSGGGPGRDERQERRRSGNRPEGGRQEKREETVVPIEEQVPVVKEFLEGLVGSFGLDGTVDVSVDGDVVVATISGEQTEAMVGPRGSVIEAIHELTKTVMHRRNQASARLRLDVAGYAERRRQALAIYAERLIDQVLEDGGEVMLEPMSASDRKVIHDAVAGHDGVRSYSEGTAPQRYVVIAKEDSAGSDGDGSDEEELVPTSPDSGDEPEISGDSSDEEE